MRARLPDLLENGRPILADGAMGTMLFSMGLEQGGSPELWNLEHPDRVRLVHRAYIEAGSQIIMTNSFGANRERLALHGLSARARELNLIAAQLAGAEADAAAHPVLVAGSMAPTGSILEPLGELSLADAVSAFQEQASALVEGGIDVFWIEAVIPASLWAKSVALRALITLARDIKTALESSRCLLDGTPACPQLLGDAPQ